MAQGRPRVNIREFDYTVSIETGSVFIAGFVGYSQKGPINQPVLITNSQQFETVFGTIGWNNQYGTYVGYAADEYLKRNNLLYIVRADVPSSTFAYIDVASGVTSWTTGAYALEAVPGSGISALSALYSNSLAGSAYSAASGVLADWVAPTGSTMLRVYSKYKGDFANGAVGIYVLNNGFFTCAATAKLSGSFVAPYLDTPPTGADEFYLAVYSSDGSILESYVASLQQGKKNSRGDNIFVEELVNSASNYIYVKANQTYISAGAITSALTIGGLAYESFSSANSGIFSIVDSVGSYVSGGSYNLTATTASNIQSALSAISNSNEYVIRAIAAPGFTDSTIVNSLQSFAEGRKDCVAAIDLPRTNATSSVAYRYTNGINSTYVATYSNWFNYYDARNDTYIYLPPSIQAVRAWAETHNNYASWYAPAGAVRGKLANVTNLDQAYTDGDLDILAMSQINPLVKLKAEGNVIWGQKTTYDFASDFRDINIRFLFIEIEQAIASYARSLIFEFNDALTRNYAKMAIDKYLSDIKNRGGVYEYKVVCDSSNNTDAVVSNNELVIDIFIKATKVAEVINLNFIATRDLVQISR